MSVIKYYIILFLFVTGTKLNAQNNQRITDYKNLLKTTSADTSKIRILFELSKKYEEINTDSSLYFLTQSLKIAEKSRSQKAISQVTYRIGELYLLLKKDESMALKWFNKSVEIAKKTMII